MPPLPTRLDTDIRENATPPKLKWLLGVVSVVLTTSFVILLNDQL